MTKKIKITKDGPYAVSGNIPLRKEKIVLDSDGLPFKWEKIKEYPLKQQYLLCRCGHTKTPPYCDQSHKEIGFNGKETASNALFDKQAEVIDGPDLILKDSPPLCVHARFCDRAGGIWDLTRKSDDKVSRETAIEEACNCPSGRLVASDRKTQKPIEPELDQSISVTSDKEGTPGPLWIKGGIPIESADGKTYEIRNRVTLCQCGRSKNKPFCDGSHYLVEENKMNPIDSLRIEHGYIKQMLLVLNKINDNIEDQKNTIIFLKEYADKLHHGKEEDYLFKMMIQNKIPDELQQIDTLLNEHKAARGIIKNMPNDFENHAKKYIVLLDQHINKENNILFPAARRSLSESQMEILENGFEDIAQNKIGEAKFEELHRIFNNLKETYL